MLMVHRVALLLPVHYCMCHGEVVPIALCKWWSSFTIGKRGGGKKSLSIFNDLIIHFFQIFFSFFIFFHFKILFCFVFKGFF
jgi:hypothetical protein